MTRPTRLLVLALLLLSASAAAAWADFKVYRPKHRTAEELLPVVQVALSEGGNVAVDRHSNALILVGTDAEISQALELLALQDQRLRTVLIQHETRTTRDLAAAGVQIAWNTGGGGARIGNVVRVPGSRAVSVRVGEGTRRDDSAQTGTVRVLEGSWGRISQGTDAIVPTGSFRDPSSVVVSAESGLEVRPRILGDGRIRLDLRPFQGSLGRGGVVSRSGADTTLVVTPGETAVVGELSGSRSSSSNSLLSGSQQAREETQQLLLVTVTIDGEASE